jgi:hypothetical protein
MSDFFLVGRAPSAGRSARPVTAATLAAEVSNAKCARQPQTLRASKNSRWLQGQNEKRLCYDTDQVGTTSHSLIIGQSSVMMQRVGRLANYAINT